MVTGQGDPSASPSTRAPAPAATGVAAGQPPIPPGEYWDRLRAARRAYQLASESLEIDESPIQS